MSERFVWGKMWEGSRCLIDYPKTRKQISVFPRKRDHMATNTSSPKPVNVVFNLPDPDQPSMNLHGEVGGTATWQSSTPNYPRFHVSFRGPNPVNGENDAKFSGEKGRPVVLALNAAGQFDYRIEQIKTDGTRKFSGPFSLGVAQPGEFQIHCPGCPPGGLSE